jgi:vitamin B12 transporter
MIIAKRLRNIAALSLFHVAQASAQSVLTVPAPAPAANPNDPLNEIVITATRVPEPIDTALEPILIIDRAELAASLAIDVGDLLRLQPGLDIGRVGGPGQPESLFIRGANSDQSIIMIDGVRINEGTIGGAALQNLDPQLFERIEIVEGPRSAIYGTDAIGGVVNLITRTSGTSSFDAMAGYGSYGTGQFALDGSYAGTSSHFQLALAGQRSDGFPSFVGEDLDAGYKNLTGVINASTSVGTTGQLGGFYWRATGTSDYANQEFSPNFPYPVTGYSPASERFSESAGAAYLSGNLTTDWHSKLLISRVIDDLSQNQDDPDAFPSVPDFDYTARNTLDWQNDLILSTGAITETLSFGAILNDEQTHALSYGTFYAVSTDTETYYLQDQFDSGASHLLLAGGEYHHPAFGDHTTWNAEYGYALSSATMLTASAGTAFRAPDATDRFGYAGNPDLLPETSRNYELGLKTRISPTQLLTLAAFQDTIDDLIMFVYDPIEVPYQGENQNIDRARIRGIEGSWDWQHDQWSARLAASLQDPENLSPGATDSQLQRRAKQTASFSATRKFGVFRLGLDLLQSGRRDDLGAATGTEVYDGGYLLVGLRAEILFTERWSLGAHLENALDHHYALADGYNTAGRSVFVDLHYGVH